MSALAKIMGCAPPTVTVSPTSVSGSRTGSGSVTSNAATMAPAGGSTLYGFSWAPPAGMTATAPASATSAFTRSLASGANAFGTAVGTVTDLQTGLTAPVNVSVSLTSSSPPPPVTVTVSPPTNNQTQSGAGVVGFGFVADASGGDGGPYTWTWSTSTVGASGSGQSATFTAHLSGPGDTVSGTITFVCFENGIQVGSGDASWSGSAT